MLSPFRSAMLVPSSSPPSVNAFGRPFQVHLEGVDRPALLKWAEKRLGEIQGRRDQTAVDIVAFLFKAPVIFSDSFRVDIF